MQTKRSLVAFSLVVLFVGTSAWAHELAGCLQCHESTSLIKGKQVGWSEAVHGSGEAYVRGTRASCAGCHSGGAFSAMVADGLRPNQVEAGDPNPTRQDCRTCHQIHTSGTAADWALETTDPVVLYAFDGVTFDGGKGNLCANCHQPRRVIAPEPDANGNIRVTSSHWGPHHGPQSAMLLGIGGAGDQHLAVAGVPSWHYKMTGDTCVTCHVGEDDSHTFEAVESACAPCHDEDFIVDVGAVQAEVQALLDQLGKTLIARGMLDQGGHPIPGTYPYFAGAALWNYIFIALEDESLGIHNPQYTLGLLKASVAFLEQTAE